MENRPSQETAELISQIRAAFSDVKPEWLPRIKQKKLAEPTIDELREAREPVVLWNMDADEVHWWLPRMLVNLLEDDNLDGLVDVVYILDVQSEYTDEPLWERWLTEESDPDSVTHREDMRRMKLRLFDKLTRDQAEAVWAWLEYVGQNVHEVEYSPSELPRAARYWAKRATER